MYIYTQLHTVLPPTRQKVMHLSVFSLLAGLWNDYGRISRKFSGSTSFVKQTSGIDCYLQMQQLNMMDNKIEATVVLSLVCIS